MSYGAKRVINSKELMAKAEHSHQGLESGNFQVEDVRQDRSGGRDVNYFARSFSHSIHGPIFAPRQPDSDSFLRQPDRAIFYPRHTHVRSPGCTTYAHARDHKGPHGLCDKDGQSRTSPGRDPDQLPGRTSVGTLDNPGARLALAQTTRKFCILRPDIPAWQRVGTNGRLPYSSAALQVLFRIAGRDCIDPRQFLSRRLREDVPSQLLDQ